MERTANAGAAIEAGFMRGIAIVSAGVVSTVVAVRILISLALFPFLQRLYSPVLPSLGHGIY